MDRYTDKMEDTKRIDDLIHLDMGSSDEGDEAFESSVKIGNADRMGEMMEAIRSIKMVVDTLDARVAKLEVENKGMKNDWVKSRTGTAVTIPNPDLLRHSKSPGFARRASGPVSSVGSGTESYANVTPNEMSTRTEEMTRDQNGSTSSYMNKEANSAMATIARVNGIKSHSAIANRGYSNKHVLWGTCFASLLVACIKKFISFTSQTGHVIDDVQLMKTYSKIVPDLYMRVKSADLPAVQSHAAMFMSKMFIRDSASDLPISSAKDWYEMSQHPDGAECMSVIESIFTGAKMVPEAMLHPISQLVSQMNQPVVRQTPKGPSFSIPTSTKISMSPGGHEDLCRCMKMESLKTYVRYRLQGESPTAVLVRMMATMKDTDIFDNRNLNRGREMMKTASTCD